MANDVLYAPCVFCNYNGADYWQSYSHAKDCPWYIVAGMTEREARLRIVLRRLFDKSKK